MYKIDTGIKVFDKYPIKFPKDDSLVAIIGENNSGKTIMLRALKKYYEEHNENVLFFPSDRIFTVDPDYILARRTASQLVEEIDLSENINRKYDLTLHPWDIERRKDTYIDNGLLQLYNFYYNIDQLTRPSVILIDNMERNLHTKIRQTLAKHLYTLPQVKKIIFTTYTYETYKNYSGIEPVVYDLKKGEWLREE